jgi:hypothetical protein
MAEPETEGVSGAIRTEPRALLFAAAILYLIIVILTSVRHEPWRDEADVWLVARDSDLSGLFTRVAHSGTPPLWYMIVMPLARLGFPYGSMLALNTAIAAAAGLVVLFLAREVPPFLRIAFLFSYYPLYEYAVIARPYALMYFLLVLAGLFWKERIEKPLRFATVSAAILWTHGLGLFLGVGPCLVAAAELAWKGRERRHFAAGLILLASVAAVGFLIWPREGGQAPIPPTSPANWEMLAVAISKGFLPGLPPYFSIVGLGLIGGIGLIAARRSFWLLLWGGAGAAGLSFFYLFFAPFLWQEWLRHFGPLPLLGLVVFMMATRVSVQGKDQRWVGVALAVAFTGSGLLGIQRSHLDWTGPFSGSAEAARFLRASGLQHRLLAAHPAANGSAILPYLDRSELYYPGEDREGSFMLWNREYREGALLPLEEVIARVHCRFDAEGGILILSQLGPRSDNLGLDLIWRSKSQPFAWRDESYRIYAVPPGQGHRCEEGEETVRPGDSAGGKQ